MQSNGKGFVESESGQSLVRQERRMPERILPEYLTDVFPEEAIEIFTNEQYIDWILESRHRLERKVGKYRADAAITNAVVHMYAAGRIDELIESQPNERLAKQAEEIGEFYLESLKGQQIRNSHFATEDIERVLREPLARETRPYKPKKEPQLTVKRRFARWLLDES